jgi:8-oxo-dGTP diphosphatase
MMSVPAVAAVLRHNNSILFLHRLKKPEPGTWALPGGKIDFGESPENALLRELNEELGINAIIGKLLGVTSFVDAISSTHWISPIYLVTSWTGTPSIQEPDKHDSLIWVSRTALPSPLMTPTAQVFAWDSF